MKSLLIPDGGGHPTARAIPPGRWANQSAEVVHRQEDHRFHTTLQGP
jgi:hypothetical protein